MYRDMTRLRFRTFCHLMMTCLAVTMMAGSSCAATDEESGTSESWYGRAFQRLETTWKNGELELYVPLHVHHVRSAYTPEKIASFNETPWGLGIGKGVYDEDGDWHGLYAMEFQDSHYKPEYMVGYGYKTFWPVFGDLKAGLGYVAFVTTRSDIGHYTPIPAALPLASLEYRRISLETAYLPGGHGNGNIFIFWGKYRF